MFYLHKSELKNFYIFQSGQFLSLFGSRMTSFAIGLWALEKTGSVFMLSLLELCFLVPEIGLSFIAGSLSDRWDKKKIMLVSDTIAAIGSFSILLLCSFNILSLPYLFVINILLGTTDAFQSPAYNVVVSLIVTKDQYIKTCGVRSFCNAVADILTPIIATAVYSAVGLSVVLIIDLFTFLYAFISLLWFVAVPKLTPKVTAVKTSVVGECKLGLQYLVHRKDIMSFIIFMAFVNFIASIYGNILTPMILFRNGGNRVQLSIVTSSVGVAGLIGSFLVTKVKPRDKKITAIINIMSFSFLFCNTTLGIGRNFYIWTLAVFLGNLLIPFLTANSEYIMRTKVPIHMQGRVFSARNTLQFATRPLGYLCGGLMSDYVLEPFMRNQGTRSSIFSFLVGTGSGSGIALLYIIIGVGGFIGCCCFRKNRNLLSLDHEKNQEELLINSANVE